MMSMRRKIFCAALVMVAAVSCVSDEEPHPVLSDNKDAMLEIRMVSGTTKVSGEGGDEEAALSDCQVLVYDMTTRKLEAYEKPSSSSSDVTLRCRTGLKEIIVLANAPDASGFVSYDDFLQKRSFLTDNNVGRLVMSGNASLDLKLSGGSVTVDLRRIAAKVILDKITVGFAQETYDDMDFILKKVYLTNVAGDMTYMAGTPDPLQWYNKIVNTGSKDVEALISDSLGDINLKDGADYTDKHHFYCYPNPYETDSFSSAEWSPRPTRLVVEAELGGVLYYYPVVLPKMERNTRYHVSLNIIRPGVSSPEQNMKKQDAEFTINVVGWQESDDVSETI